MSTTWFTSDWHLGDTRFDIMFRDFESVEENDNTVLQDLLNGTFKDGDTLIHLGDVIQIKERNLLDKYDKMLSNIKSKFPNSKFYLINGNYDMDDEYKHKVLNNFFDTRHDDTQLNSKAGILYLNHYPTKVKERIKWSTYIGITGHIHSMWKVQKNIINVGVDVWNYRFVSTKKLLFLINGMKNHYDENVFLYTE